jgi:lysylphosphatidylglycerol synthetase-like protein (DUF2156 family)
MDLSVLAQIAVAVIAGLVVLGVERLIISRGKWRQRPQPEYEFHVRDGNQLNVAGSVAGDVNAEINDQRTIQHNHIVNNISVGRDEARRKEPKAKTENTDPWTEIFLAVVVAVVAIGLFVLYHELLLAITAGLVVALLAVSASAITRTRRRMAAWPDNGTPIIVGGVLSVIGAAATWVGIFLTSRDSYSLSGARQIAAGSSSGKPQSFSDVVTQATVQIRTVVEAYGLGGLGFLILLLLAAAAAIGPLVLSLIHLFDWHVYLRFAEGYTNKPFLVRRAESFLRPKIGWTVWTLVVVAVSIGLAWGLFYDVLPNLNDPPPLLPSATNG